MSRRSIGGVFTAINAAKWLFLPRGLSRHSSRPRTNLLNGWGSLLERAERSDQPYENDQEPHDKTEPARPTRVIRRGDENATSDYQRNTSKVPVSHRPLP